MATTSATGTTPSLYPFPTPSSGITARHDWSVFERSSASPPDDPLEEASLKSSSRSSTPSRTSGHTLLRGHSLDGYRALHIPLMLSERGWAHGMQKKNELTIMGHSLKRRGTMLRKLSQSVKASNALRALCDKRCDPKSCLEAEGYSELMKGISCMETERKWKEALLHYSKAKAILEGLAKISEVEVQSIFLQAIEEMEPNVRFCRYELEKLEEAEEKLDLSGLQARLEEMQIATGPGEEAQSALSMTWCHHQYHVKNERLSELLQTAQKYEKQIAGTKDYGSLVTVYEKAIGAYHDMENNIKKALAAGGGVSVFAGEDLEQLQMAAVGKLLRHSIEKTKLQIHRNHELFQEILIKALTSKKQQAVKSRAETLVRLCDTIVGLILEQSDLGTKLGGAHGEQLIEECTLLVSYYQAYRCYFLAHVFYSGGSFPEGYALFDRSLERIDHALGQHIDLMEDGRHQLAEDLQTLKTRTHAYRCAAQSEISAHHLLDVREAQEKLEVMELLQEEPSSKKKKAVVPAKKYMADHPSLWESFVGTDGKNIRLFKIPPPLSPVPVRPFILDAVPDHIKEPDVKHRLPPEEAQGVFSKILGGLTGWR